MTHPANVGPTVTKGLFVTVEAKPGREADIEAMLRSGLAEVQKEPDTIAWLAIRLGPTTFAVADVFPDDAGRQFHLDAGRERLTDGPLADLLAAPLTFTYTDVVAAKLPDGSSEPALERNKETVLAFYQSAINDKDFDAASALLGDHYTQHNPAIADGAEGLKGRIDLIREKFPELRAEVKRIVAEGDLVIAHVHGVRAPDQPGTAVVDIFRLDGNGKLVEHWDVMQDVPDHAENPNGMF
jgi:predicted SnoaL-like aldol condensation-catalyzing enzyme